MQTLKEFLTHNWLIKLFSLGLATLLWMTIAGQANSEIGMIIPLEYRNIPSLLEFVGEPVNSVEVRLRGSATLILEMSPKDVSATLDLNAVHPGALVLQLSSQNIKVPFGIDVVRVNPSQIHLDLEHTISKNVPVVVRISGEPAAGFAVDGVSASPAAVDVEGPESKMRSVQTMPTVAVDINDMNTSFNGPVNLELPDPTLRLRYLSPVAVHVEIDPESPESKRHGGKR